MVIINRILFFCEIIQCKNIILNKAIYWFIKKDIIIQNIKISVSGNKKKYFNNPFSLNYDSFKNFLYLFTFKPEIRIHFLRDEILGNIPKITIN